jgi:uncharacterized membrane protein YhaH (DUF805 family)
MNFTDAVSNVYRNYATFSGRARRPEYWWFVLFSIIAGIVIGIIESSLGFGHGMMMHGGGEFGATYTGGPLTAIWSVVNFVPTLAVGVRRLHDTDRSGWWFLIGLIPLVGAIVLIVFLATKGSSGPNRFGEDPIR